MNRNGAGIRQTAVRIAVRIGFKPIVCVALALAMTAVLPVSVTALAESPVIEAGTGRGTENASEPVDLPESGSSSETVALPESGSLQEESAQSETSGFFDGEWLTDADTGTNRFMSEALDMQITVPGDYVVSELAGLIRERSGNAQIAFAVADHPVDMESNVTVVLGSCRHGETKAQGDAGQVAASYRQLLLGPVMCTETEPLQETELGGYTWWKLSVREAHGLFLYPMNMDFYLRDTDDRLVILAFAYYDAWSQEVDQMKKTVTRASSPQAVTQQNKTDTED